MAKARKKKRLFIIYIIVAALIAACAAVYFGFRTDKITYVGNSHYSNEEMTSRIFGNDTPNTVLYTLFGKRQYLSFRNMMLKYSGQEVCT